MYRIVLMVLKLFYKVPYYLYRIGKYGKLRERETNMNTPNTLNGEAFQFIKKVTVNANKAGNVIIEAHGLENIPEKTGFMFFPNHQGLFDVLSLLESCPVPFSFVIKKEASRTILLKQVISALGAIAIDRQDIRQSMEVINEVAKRVVDGENFLIFPEGTRSKEGNKVQDFKGGSFKSAYKSKCPIVPCALIDAYKPFDEKSIQTVSVKVFYLEPIYYEEYKGLKTTEIAKEVKERIETAINSYLLLEK